MSGSIRRSGQNGENSIELEIDGIQADASRSNGNIVNANLFCNLSDGFKKEFNSSISSFTSSQSKDEINGNSTTVRLQQNIAKKLIFLNDEIFTVW